ncbi:hypothetical protein RMCBS344292_14428 [Rhizopus microsporus]|nr:hypothetical protein RMCBS344292_14428 [Rhizopus microsporus]
MNTSTQSYLYNIVNGSNTKKNAKLYSRLDQNDYLSRFIQKLKQQRIKKQKLREMRLGSSGKISQFGVQTLILDHEESALIKEINDAHQNFANRRVLRHLGQVFDFIQMQNSTSTMMNGGDNDRMQQN